MHRVRVGGAIVVGVVAAVATLGAVSGDSRPRFTDGTPDDLRAVASDAWRRFEAAVPACAGRLGGLTVGVAWDLADRARYEPGRALVLVRAPGTAPNLEATLLHEYAHHAEHRCPPGSALRARFTAAGELPPGTPWRRGEAWDRVPSERFAEALVTHILGRPPPHVLIHLRPAEVRMVAAWARGG